MTKLNRIAFVFTLTALGTLSTNPVRASDDLSVGEKVIVLENDSSTFSYAEVKEISAGNVAVTLWDSSLESFGGENRHVGRESVGKISGCQGDVCVDAQVMVLLGIHAQYAKVSGFFPSGLYGITLWNPMLKYYDGRQVVDRHSMELR